MERMSISKNKYRAMIALIALLLAGAAGGSWLAYSAGFATGNPHNPESEPIRVMMVINHSDAPTRSILTLNSGDVVESDTFSFVHKVEKCEGGKEEVTVEFEVDVKVDATVNLSVLANEKASLRTLGPDERFIALDVAYDIATGLWMVTYRISLSP